METIIVGYRKWRKEEGPAFALILDADIILNHEIAEENAVTSQPVEMQVIRNRNGNGNPAGPQEMDGADEDGSGSNV